MKDIEELLNYGLEGLSGALKENLHAKEAFKEIARGIGKISALIAEESEGTIGTRGS